MAGLRDVNEVLRLMKHLLLKLQHLWRSNRPMHAPQPSWRKVLHGPLKDYEFLLPEGGWADRIVAGVYEPELFGAMLGCAAGRGTLYDIGAHVGYFTCAWMAVGGQGVETFEPVPLNARVVADTVRRNSIAAVKIHQLALGSYTGKGKLMVDIAGLNATSMAYVDEIGGIDSQRKSYRYRNSRAIDTAVSTLDDLFENARLPQPAILKIDVEGAEASVLQGAAKVLDACRPVILAEVHSVDAGLRMADQLSRLHYQLSVLGKNHSGMSVCMWRGG
jgi:FkbM family methyltransferase